MAGKKKNARKFRLPKKIAGYKIPRSLRKSDILVQLAQNPKVREICAAGMVAAAAALVGSKNARHAAGDTTSTGGSQLAELVSTIGSVASALLRKSETARDGQTSTIEDGQPSAKGTSKGTMPAEGSGPH